MINMERTKKTLKFDSPYAKAQGLGFRGAQFDASIRKWKNKKKIERTKMLSKELISTKR